MGISLFSKNSQKNAIYGCDGSASVTVQGGQQPYTYLWYSGNPSNSLGVTSGLTGLCAGVYNVKVTDASNTFVSSIFTITQPSPVSGSVISTLNVACPNGSNGSIVVKGTGGYAPTGYTYNLTGLTTSATLSVAGNATFNNLPADSYSVQVVDYIGSTYNISPIVLTQPQTISLNPTQTNLICYNSSVIGTITLTPTGGTSGNYDITFIRNTSPSYQTQNLISVGNSYTYNNLDFGSYTIKVSRNGCTGNTENITITRRPEFNISSTESTTLTNPLSVTATTSYTSGSFTSAIPTTPPNTIKYYVDNVLTSTCTGGTCLISSTVTKSIFSLSTGNTYTIMAVDSNSCSATTVVTI